MSDYYFRTADLSVGYNGRTLIHDIGISLRAGDILTLIGPNGSGKSTILKSVTKHLAMIAGDAYIADASVTSMSYKELSQKLAVVLTERIKGELLTCYDVVATGRYPYTNTLGLLSPEDHEKVRGAMERVHALELAEKDFTAISDGQRQRVLLARAICQEPEIIVLDEPTSFLDIRHKLELLSILRSMAKEKGITVVMSLHEIDLAQKVSDKVMCVHGDHISNFGTPEEIFTEEIIGELYGITPGTYNTAYGSVELPPPEGEPETFVISGCGCGVSLYRRLQKENIPFYAGILFENDLELPIARALAAEVVTAPAFSPIGDEVFDRAKELLGRCKTVYVTDFPMAEGNARLRELVDTAQEAGLLLAMETSLKKEEDHADETR